MKKIAVIILHYNGTEDTFECIRSVQNSDKKNFVLEIIVVDNHSRDEFRARDIKIIRTEENLGYSGGNNVGIKYALGIGADYIVILNNDTRVDKESIAHLFRLMDEDKKVGIVAPKIYFEKGNEFHKDRYGKNDLGKVIWYAGGVMDWNNVIGRHRGVDEVDRGQYDNVGETDFASGCCLMISRIVLESIGMFNEKYFLYYEDNDLCQRTLRAGFKIIYLPSAVIWHKNAGSAGGSGSSLQDYYITRNRLYFGYTFAPLKSRIALLRESLRLVFSGRSWQKKGIVDYYIGRMGKGGYI